MAYLGFHKGGAKFSLATSAYTKGGQTRFSNFFPMSKKKFLAKGGAMAQWPPLNTPLPASSFTASRLFLRGRLLEGWRGNDFINQWIISTATVASIV